MNDRIKTPILGRVGSFITKLGNQLSQKSSVFSYSGSTITEPVSGVPIGAIRICVNDLFTIWRNHADVFACVRELSQNALVEGYKWVDKRDQSKDAPPRSAEILEQILNFNGSFEDLKEQMIRHVHIAGNAYLLIQKAVLGGKPLGVQLIDPRTLSVVTNEYGEIKAWIQRVHGNTQVYQPDEVVQWKICDDPNSPVFGLSPLEPIIWEVRTDLAAMVSNYAFFLNDAVPAAQYILEDNISNDAYEWIKTQLADQLKGSDKRHKSIAIKGVKEIKTISISNKDMEFSVLRRFSTEKVCSALGVPKSILNYTDDVNYANGDNQTKKFWEGTINPLDKSFARFVNGTLLPVLGIEDSVFKPNERKFDTREYVETSTREDLKHGILTINEVRKMRGHEPFNSAQDGDFVDKPIIYAGASAVPVTDVGVDPQELDSFVSPDDAAKAIARVEGMAKMHSYGKRKNL